MRHKRRHDPTVNLLPHAPRNQRADLVELILQQVQNIRQRRRCLRGKEIDIGIRRVRQRTLVHRRSAGVIASVMRTQHPRRFLADAPKPVDYAVQIGSVIRQTFRQRRAHEHMAPGEIRRFIRLPVPRSAEREKLRCRNHRIAALRLFPPFKHLPPLVFGEGVPRVAALPLWKWMVIFTGAKQRMKITSA